MLTTFLRLVSGLALAAVLAGCRSSDSSRSLGAVLPGKIQVVATIPPLADWARRVGGDHVEATVLLPPGTSPHVFEPSASDMKRVAGAEVFLSVGLNMDDWAARLARAAGPRQKVVAVGDALAERKVLPPVDDVLSATETIEGGADDDSHAGHDHDHDHHGHDHDHGPVNPHFWLDPMLARESLQEIRDALAAVAPQHADEFTANARQYALELEDLDRELSATLEPVRGRGFVSFHNAFPYLAHRYGLTIVAVIEESPGKTPSERYVRRVADRLRALGIRTVFSEPQLNPRVAQILAAEVGAEVDVLDPYGSTVDEDRDTYQELMRFNAARLRRALE